MMRRRRRVVDKIIQCSRRVGGRRAKGRRTAWLIGRGGQVGHVVDIGFGVDVLIHVMVVVGIVGIVVVMFADGSVGAVDGESAVFVGDAHCECVVGGPGACESARRVSRGGCTRERAGQSVVDELLLRPGGSCVSLVPTIQVMAENVVEIYYLKWRDLSSLPKLVVVARL